MVSIGDSVDFDNTFNCTYFNNITKGERIAAFVTYLDIRGNIESYCK
jgi:hypothetical protein